MSSAAPLSLLVHDDGSAPCPLCGQQSELRTCAGCGDTARIIDCGHMSQPRPIAPGGRYGGESSCDDCEAVADELRCHCGEITGVRCAADPVGLRPLHYLPAHLAGTARTLSSARGMLSSAAVCEECFRGHLLDYYDADLMCVVAAV